MKVRDQRGELFLAESPGKGRHGSLTCQNHAPHLGIRGGRAAGQIPVAEKPVKNRRNLLESQIVVLVAVGATNLVEVLAFHFLRSQRRC